MMDTLGPLSLMQQLSIARWPINHTDADADINYFPSGVHLFFAHYPDTPPIGSVRIIL